MAWVPLYSAGVGVASPRRPRLDPLRLVRGVAQIVPDVASAACAHDVESSHAPLARSTNTAGRWCGWRFRGSKARLRASACERLHERGSGSRDAALAAFRAHARCPKGDFVVPPGLGTRNHARSVQDWRRFHSLPKATRNACCNPAPGSYLGHARRERTDDAEFRFWPNADGQATGRQNQPQGARSTRVPAQPFRFRVLSAS